MARRKSVAAGPCRRLWRACVACGFAVASLTSQAGQVEPPGPSTSDYQRTTFTEKEGAPGRNWAIAQTNDGWLWFGGSTGLMRFDGVAFERVDVSTSDGRLSRNVSTLYALPSGGLAIGHMSGGITILERGSLRHFDSEAVRAAGRPFDFLADAQGTLWASFDNGLMRLVGNEWVKVSADWNFPEGTASDLYGDVSGTVWVKARSAVLRLTKGSRRFEPVWTVPDGGQLVRSPAGVFWHVDQAGITCLCDPHLIAPADRTEASRKSSSYYFDRSGALWGVPSDVPQRPTFAVRDADSFRSVSIVLEDVDGNVWMAGSDPRVDRLRRSAIGSVPLPASKDDTLVSTSLGVDDAGSLWLTTTYKGFVSGRAAVWRVQGDRPQLMFEGTGHEPTIATDRSGRVFWTGRRGLWEWNGSRVSKKADLPDAAGDDLIGAVAVGCAGGAWVAAAGAGLFKLDELGWRAAPEKSGLPSGAPTTLLCDSAGLLWLGYDDGRIATLNASGEVAFIDFAGASIGSVSSISVGNQVLVGGERGLAVLQRGRFVKLAARLPTLEGVTGIAQAPEGSVWLSGARGLVRLKSTDIDAASENNVVPAELFDAEDGFPGPALSTARPSRTLAQDGRGRLWFAGSGGLAYLDAPVPQDGAAPRPVLKSLVVDGRAIDAIDPPTLPQGTRSLQIAYTALGAVHPARLRFRYRLQGVDEGWIDAGDRRQAFYTNLSPRTHRFEVDVTDESGTYLNRPATVDFYIEPTFAQSRLFQALCVALAVGVLLVAYRLRIRQIERRQQQLMVERLDERERIARELHDTLLQGTQALILKVHAAGEMSRKGEPVHEALEKALDQATIAIVEARNGIEDLRSRFGPADDLASSLMRFGEELMKSGQVRFEGTLEGDPRALDPRARREAYLIGREALLNAFHHAQASTIELQVAFSADALVVRVRDDGRGFDDTVLTRPPGGRHWGLPGMQERARAIPATLQVWSRPGAGTEVDLRLAAEVAYTESEKHRQGRSFSRLLRRRAPPG